MGLTMTTIQSYTYYIKVMINGNLTFLKEIEQIVSVKDEEEIIGIQGEKNMERMANILVLLNNLRENRWHITTFPG